MIAAGLTAALGILPDGYKPCHAMNTPTTAMLKKESDSFLHRIFGGSVKPLLMHFAQKEALSDEEMEELRKVLRKKQK